MVHCWNAATAYCWDRHYHSGLAPALRHDAKRFWLNPHNNAANIDTVGLTVSAEWTRVTMNGAENNQNGPSAGQTSCDESPDSQSDVGQNESSDPAKKKEVGIGLPSEPMDVQRFVDNLAAEERMLVVLQRELYEGSWKAMLNDLRNRLEGKPYIFKLANRIRDDIERIETLQQFEEDHKVKLADFVQSPE